MIEIGDLKAWLGNPQGNGINALLTSLEARAVDILQKELDRYFGSEKTHTEIIEGDGTRRLWLNEAPSSLTSIEERYRPGDSWTAIAENDSDGWELRAPKSSAGVAAVHRKNGHTWRFGYEYRVVYTFGYAAGSEPPDVRQAVLDLVALKFAERGRAGLRSESIGDYSYTTLADSMGRRDLHSIPGWSEVRRRWRRGTRSMA